MARVVFFEIDTINPETTIQFFKGVFDWKFSQYNKQNYWLMRTGDDELPGINGAVRKKGHNEITNIIEVDSLVSIVQKIEQNGGRILEIKENVDLGKMVFFEAPDSIKMAAIEFYKS
ncbi:VOC family protein [Fulvivirga sp.]|uniref:VOC family protein n=1 Tax=Fulvivirga sp. TaxID=1931237 RepID=UPI0032EAD929